MFTDVPVLRFYGLFYYFLLIYSYSHILLCLTPHHRTSNCTRLCILMLFTSFFCYYYDLPHILCLSPLYYFTLLILLFELPHGWKFPTVGKQDQNRILS